MASAAPTADNAPADVPAKKKSGRKGLILGVLVLLLAAGGGATWMFVLKPKAEAEHAASAEAEVALPAPAVYLPLDPAFVVNLDDPYAAHYLQAEVQLMARDPIGLETARAQMPRIRNSLLMLFGQQKPTDLSTREGKERLQTAALAEVQKVMQSETGKPVVEAVYFTSFVMQ